MKYVPDGVPPADVCPLTGRDRTGVPIAVTVLRPMLFSHSLEGQVSGSIGRRLFGRGRGSGRLSAISDIQRRGLTTDRSRTVVSLMMPGQIVSDG